MEPYKILKLFHYCLSIIYVYIHIFCIGTKQKVYGLAYSDYLSISNCGYFLKEPLFLSYGKYGDLVSLCLVTSLGESKL